MSRTYEAFQKSRTLGDKRLQPVNFKKKSVNISEEKKEDKQNINQSNILSKFQFVNLEDTNEIGVLAQRIERISMKRYFTLQAPEKGKVRLRSWLI